ncbi:MAG: GIY-YIG nuclease family protein [Streptomyces sp.]|nr:GIY-YIG nuclease family protein [Streptomyces sp.]
MNHDHAPACIADDEGRPCPREATVLRPVALCHAHRIEIALTIVPELLRNGLETALTTSTPTIATYDELVATATATPVEDLLHGVHDSVVYFIANGGRVKIGYTTNLKSRLGALALRSDSVLLTLQGGPELERALHARFAEHRNGNTEWFELSPEIFRYASGRNAAPRGGVAASGLFVAPRPVIADLAREQVAITTDNAEAVRNIMAAWPHANKESVAALVRRERRKTQDTQGYA